MYQLHTNTTKAKASLFCQLSTHSLFVLIIITIIDPYIARYPVIALTLLHETFLQFDWLRAVVFQLNLKYLHVKITNLLWVEV